MGLVLLTIIALLFSLLILVRRWWAARIVQVWLILAAAEWIRALLAFVEMYEMVGRSWTRLAVILGGVAIFTFGSALLLFCRPLKNYIRIKSANQKFLNRKLG